MPGVLKKNIRLLDQKDRNDDALNTLSALYRCISAKIALYDALNQAYSAKDSAALRDIAEKLIPETVKVCQHYGKLFRDNWLKNAKPFGLEVMQRRAAGMIDRLNETGLRINEYLDGKVSAIEEVESRLASTVTEGNPFTACWIS